MDPIDKLDHLNPAAALGPALELRDMIARARADIREFHANGGSGEQVTAALTSLCDRVVGKAYELIDTQTGRRDQIANHLALVAVGGYGRGDLAPYSDVDLLFLTAQPPDELIRNFVSALVRLLWDSGLSVAQSVRTPSECVAFAQIDLPAWTALTEARLLQGNIMLFKALRHRIRKMIQRQSVRRLAEGILEERNKEEQDYHTSTVYLLEPSIKKSAGGLRDYHFIRWVGHTRYGTPDPAPLREQGHLSERDFDQIVQTRELLLRIRNELHFLAQSAQDVLTLDEQVRLAEWLGFAGSDGLLPVEQFMQHYYRQTTALHDISLRFAQGAGRTRGSGWLPLLTRRRIDDRFLLEGDSIRPARARDFAATGDAQTLLHLFELARCHDVAVDARILEQVRTAVQTCEVTSTARRYLLQVLGNPVGLGRLLRDIHRVGLLSRLIPPFEHVRCLIQFNEYHKYTVDEHTLRAIEAMIARTDDHGPIASAYRHIRRKDLLHLAILMHDVGKGFNIDHSQKGAELTETLARDFELSDHDRGLLLFLVRHHLLMAHTSQRRDIADPGTIVQFARTVGTPEALSMLFVLTIADTEAVSPGNLTQWKETLLLELFARTMQELTGQAPMEDASEQAQRIRRELEETLVYDFRRGWLTEQLELMPEGYLLATDASRIADHLQAVHDHVPGEIVVRSNYDAKTGISTYTIVTGEGERPGIFSRIAGVLAASGFQILAAQIVTRPDGLALDTFDTMDLDFVGAPPPHRVEELKHRLRDVFAGRQTVESLMGRRFAPRNKSTAIHRLPTQIEIDNESSESFTIVEVFADDRQGLLYIITRTLSDLGVSIHSAKIATRLDQIVDVFYVKDADARKIVDPARLDTLRHELLRQIEAALESPPLNKGGQGGA